MDLVNKVERVARVIAVGFVRQRMGAARRGQKNTAFRKSLNAASQALYISAVFQFFTSFSASGYALGAGISAAFRKASTLYLIAAAVLWFVPRRIFRSFPT